MTELDTHVAAVQRLIARTPAQPGARRLIAIAGPPGSGKSTLADAVVAALTADSPDAAALVPMDGFHLDNAALDAAGLRAVKGAPQTFDVAGFAALLQQARVAGQAVVYPLFDRAADCTVPGAGHVGAQVPLLIVEGNYLLLRAPGWADLAALFDASVMLAPPIATLEARLIARWRDHGLDPQAARARATGNDLANARTVLADSRAPDLHLPDADAAAVHG